MTFGFCVSADLSGCCSQWFRVQSVGEERRVIIVLLRCITEEPRQPLWCMIL